MSYQITITGHTRNPHNAQIKEIAEEAWAKVAALHDDDETPPSLTGYSGDQTGSITLMPTPQPLDEAKEDAEPTADTSSQVQDEIAGGDTE